MGKGFSFLRDLLDTCRIQLLWMLLGFFFGSSIVRYFLIALMEFLVN